MLEFFFFLIKLKSKKKLILYLKGYESNLIGSFKLILRVYIKLEFKKIDEYISMIKINLV